MSFWDKVKEFFGGAPAPAEEEAAEAEKGTAAPVDPLAATLDRALQAAIIQAIAWRAQQKVAFVPMDIVNEAMRAVKVDVRVALGALESLYKSGGLARWGYTRTNYVYHPVGADPSSYKSTPAPPRPPSVAPAAAVAVASSARPRPPPSAPRAQVPSGPDAFAVNPEILGLSADALRARALKVDPYRTAWIGRVDTIPPQSDERTALIDRGLVLRGLLNENQIAEIHRVGDQWLRHHDAIQLAHVVALKSAEKALEQARAEKAAKKAEKKRLADEKRAARVAEIARRRAEDVIFLGRGVSSKLGDRRAHVEKLTEAGLPVLATPADVAREIGFTIPELRWLAFHAEAAEKTHYVYFEIPKRSGGTRLLASPHTKMRKAQSWVLENVLQKMPVTPDAHGFVAGRSTVTNALPHVGKDVVVNLDLEDFFPSIGFARVRGLFESFGYSPAAATVLGLLCTESPRTPMDVDGKRYWVAAKDRALPQGACTSPALSNLVTRTLDRRMAGMAKKLGWTYTRYADDLTFSADGEAKKHLGLLLSRVRHIVGEEGFRVNAKKGRVLRAGGRQEVTGVVVNDKPGVAREEVRRLRAILHLAEKTGLAAQNRENLPHFEAWLHGKIGYVMMVDRAKGTALAERLARVLSRSASP